MALFRRPKDAGQHAAVADDLDTQIARAHDATRALETLVAAAEIHRAALPDINASLATTARRAADASQQLDGLVARLDDFEQVHRQMQVADAHVRAVESRLEKAEAHARQLDEDRSSVEQLVALAQTALARIDTLKEDRSAFLELEERLARGVG